MYSTYTAQLKLVQVDFNFVIVSGGRLWLKIIPPAPVLGCSCIIHYEMLYQQDLVALSFMHNVPASSIRFTSG